MIRLTRYFMQKPVTYEPNHTEGLVFFSCPQIVVFYKCFLYYITSALKNTLKYIGGSVNERLQRRTCNPEVSSPSPVPSRPEFKSSAELVKSQLVCPSYQLGFLITRKCSI